MKDPSDILGVEPAATPDEIERARRALARELHPDANPDDTVAVNRFGEVAWAPHLPGAPGRRAESDAGGRQHGHAGGFGPERARRGDDDGVSDFNDGIGERAIDLFGDIASNRRVVFVDAARLEVLTCDLPPEQPGEAHQGGLDPDFQAGVVDRGGAAKVPARAVVAVRFHACRSPAQ